MNPEDPRHGSVAGYNAHRKHGVEPCADCRRAMATYGAQLEYDHMQGRPRALSATGTIRRVQALVALGYTFGQIGAALGLAHDGARHLAVTPKRRVRSTTASRVAEVYERWCMTPAPDSKGAKYARTTARRRGWVPPLAWLDIDDPNERPDLGVIQHIHRGRPIAHTLEDYDFLISCGESKEQALARLGVTGEAIEVARRRAKERAA